MQCPYCGSFDVEYDENYDGDFYTRCVSCGTSIEDFDGDPPGDDYNCGEEGHDWEIVALADGTECQECSRCGATDC